MTRDDVKKIFPDATDEQISSFLNQSNSDVAKEKAKAQKVKEQADKAAELQKKLEELEQQNMTEAERLENERKKEKAENEKRISDLEAALAESNKKSRTSEITALFADAGLSSETYSSAIKAFANMPVDGEKEDPLEDVKAFVKGVSETNKTALETAKAAWEKEALDKTPNPGGSSRQQKNEPKSKAEEYFSKYLAPQKATTNTPNISSEGEK